MQICERCRSDQAVTNSHGVGLCTVCAHVLRIGDDSSSRARVGQASSSLAKDLILPGLGTSDEVTARKKKLGDVVSPLDQVVRTRSTVPDDVRSNWRAFGQDFAQWFNADTSWMTAYDDAAKASDYQEQVRSWQIQIGKYTDIGMPVIEHPPTFSQVLQKGVEATKSVSSTIKTVAIVGGLVGVGVLGYLFYSAHRAESQARRTIAEHPELLKALV